MDLELFATVMGRLIMLIGLASYVSRFMIAWTGLELCKSRPVNDSDRLN